MNKREYEKIVIRSNVRRELGRLLKRPRSAGYDFVMRWAEIPEEGITLENAERLCWSAIRSYQVAVEIKEDLLARIEDRVNRELLNADCGEANNDWTSSELTSESLREMFREFTVPKGEIGELHDPFFGIIQGE